jgi:DnaJ-class molecular chaperone
MDFQDYYTTLGVPRTAGQADIKKAFRKLAREHHPDKKPGDKAAEQRFKAINEANAVLSDADKRKKYDRLGKDWEAYSRAGVDPDAGRSPFGAGSPFGGAAGAGSPGGGTGPGVRYEFRTSGGGSAGSTDFSDFFRTFFGADAGAGTGGAATPGPGARRGPATGPSFEDILSGMGLSGSHPGAARPASTGPAAAPARPGPTAEAVAEIDLEEAYHGTTRRLELDGRRLDVTIPRGADSGTKIKLSGQGPRGGDIIVTTRVRPHPVFTRKGSDLERDLPITLAEAVLGGEVPVTTLKGKVLLRIPPGTQNGHRFRLKGQGMPHLRGEGFGDLYAKARVVLPPKLDDKTAEAARAFFDKLDQPDPRATT